MLVRPWLHPSPYRIRLPVLHQQARRTYIKSQLEPVISSSSTHHHDLQSFLDHAKNVGLKETGKVYQGTLYEYTVHTALKKLHFNLTRVGRRSDAGIDLIGTWKVPSYPHPLRVFVQCKAFSKALGPQYIRELEGSFGNLPEGWRGAGVIAFLASRQHSGKAVREAIRNSKMPMGFINVRLDGSVRELVWNRPAHWYGLEGLTITQRYMPGTHQGDSRVHYEVAMYWNRILIPFAKDEEGNVAGMLSGETKKELIKIGTELKDKVMDRVRVSRVIQSIEERARAKRLQSEDPAALQGQDAIDQAEAVAMQTKEDVERLASGLEKTFVASPRSMLPRAVKNTVFATIKSKGDEVPRRLDARYTQKIWSERFQSEAAKMHKLRVSKLGRFPPLRLLKSRLLKSTLFNFRLTKSRLAAPRRSGSRRVNITRHIARDKSNPLTRPTFKTTSRRIMKRETRLGAKGKSRVSLRWKRLSLKASKTVPKELTASGRDEKVATPAKAKRATKKAPMQKMVPRSQSEPADSGKDAMPAEPKKASKKVSKKFEGTIIEAFLKSKEETQLSGKETLSADMKPASLAPKKKGGRPRKVPIDRQGFATEPLQPQNPK